MKKEMIRIKGARENNLKNIDYWAESNKILCINIFYECSLFVYQLIYGYKAVLLV